MNNLEKPIDKDKIAREDCESIVGLFVMSVSADIASKDVHDPSIWPKWSDNTVAYWEQIEQRMKNPPCLGFDWEAAKKEIRDEIELQKQCLKNIDHHTSWRVGIKEGLLAAYRIMEKHVKLKEGKDDA